MKINYKFKSNENNLYISYNVRLLIIRDINVLITYWSHNGQWNYADELCKTKCANSDYCVCGLPPLLRGLCSSTFRQVLFVISLLVLNLTISGEISQFYVM